MRRLGCTLLLILGACAADRQEPPPASRRLPEPPPARVGQRPAPVEPALQPARPSWQMAPVVADAPERPARSVIAQPGEGLAAIARREGVPLAVLAAANQLDPPYALNAGQAIRIPAGRLHVVKRGEVLSAITRAYKVGLAATAKANLLDPPYTLEVGDVVFLPSRPQPTIEERARANKLDIDRLIAGLPPQRTPPAPVRPTPKPAVAPPATGQRPAGEATQPQAGQPAPVRPVAGEPTAPVLAGAPRFDWPIEGRILSAFGRKPGGRVNDGVNIAAVAGAPVRAAADGQVIYAGTTVPAFGGLILIRHADGWITAYGHNDALLVARGDQVTRGQVIAKAGATGEVDAPQLHFEIRKGRLPVNPLSLLAVRPG